MNLASTTLASPDLRHAIVHGRPGTKMEAFAGALSDAEIDGVVSYLRGMAGGAPMAQLPEPTGHEPLVLNPSGPAPKFTLDDLNATVRRLLPG